MRRLTSLCAAAAIALSAATIVTPAKAAPYHLIRWDNTGYCQIWDLGLTIKPVRWPADYKVISKPIPTVNASLATKNVLVQKGTCRF